MTTTPRTATTMLIKIALVTLLAVATAAYAQPGPGGPGGPGGPRGFKGGPGGPARPGMARGMIKSRVMEAHREGRGKKGKWGKSAKLLLLPQVREKLGITEDQATKIKTAIYDNEKQVITLQAQVKIAELDMKQLLEQNRPDQGKVLAQVDAVAKAKTDLAKAKMQEHLAVRAILTDQQIDKIKAFMQERAAKRGEWGRGGRGRGHGQWGRGPQGRGPWGRGGFGQGGPQQGKPGQGQGGPGQGGQRGGAGGAGMFGMPGHFGPGGPRPAFNTIGMPGAFGQDGARPDELKPGVAPNGPRPGRDGFDRPGQPGRFGQDGVNAPGPERLRQMRQRLMERRNQEFGNKPDANPWQPRDHAAPAPPRPEAARPDVKKGDAI